MPLLFSIICRVSDRPRKKAPATYPRSMSINFVCAAIPGDKKKAALRRRFWWSLKRSCGERQQTFKIVKYLICIRYFGKQVMHCHSVLLGVIAINDDESIARTFKWLWRTIPRQWSAPPTESIRLQLAACSPCWSPDRCRCVIASGHVHRMPGRGFSLISIRGRPISIEILLVEKLPGIATNEHINFCVIGHRATSSGEMSQANI